MDIIKPQRKILRSPSVKRRTKVLPVDQRVKLERVLGVTCSTNSSLDCDPNNGTIAYPAGCVTVLFNPQRNKQTHIFNVCKKFISAVAFSRDGKYLVTGENGHQPAVRIWDVAEKTQVAELLGHKFGVNCVTFSPNSKEVVSVGTQNDMMIIVWNWKSGNKVASNKVSSKVSAIAYSEDGKCFVTVGSRHVRFWYLEDRRSKINQTVPLAGRSGILGDQKDNFFCDVVSGKGKMCGRFFAITQSGLLCEINEKRLLDKWVELRTKSANCITSGTEHIFVGCAEGVVRIFNATTLHYLCSLPKPHHLGVEITTATTARHMVSGGEDANYPDTKCIAFDDDHKKVTCVYNDRSVYVWDVHDLKRVGKAWSFLYHSGCVLALEVYPQLDEGVEAMLPPGSFLTGSRDDTIRVWNLNTHMPENTTYKRNIYSNELLKIIYSDPALASLTEVDYNPAGGTDKTDTKYDEKYGIRSIRVSPEGSHLASGDRQGNIRIYDMKYLNEIRNVEAHDSDVMCLEYSFNKFGQFLATASRDRLIHVFDVEENYGLVQTLGDHSSSITAVRFTDNNDKLGMITCGMDKSILIRNATMSPDFQFQLEHHLATKFTLYDMVIDPSQKYLATACQDRNVRLYNILSRKEKKCYRGTSGDDGVLLRIHLDPSGSYAATACTDKSVCIVDFESGDTVATMYGHSETITGVKFANDLKHLITVSADGCIFVWRLPSEMTTQIKGRLLELGKEMGDTDYLRSDQLMMPNPIAVDPSHTNDILPVMKAASIGNIPMVDDESVFSQDYPDGDDEDEDHPFNAKVNPGMIKKPLDDSINPASLAYRFSVGQLPNWAKAKFGEGGSEGSESSQEMAPPKGRWAQRVDRSVEFKSQLDLTSDDESQSDRRRESATHPSQLSDIRRQTMVLGKQLGHKGIPIIGDDRPLRASTPDLSSLPKRGFATPTRSDTYIHSRPDNSLKKLTQRFDLLKGYSLEQDDLEDMDTGSDTTEVIYPPTESDSDIYASSYQVFATDGDKKSKSRGSLPGVANLDDVTSESTDPISLEEEEDGTVVSNPTTPSDPEKDFMPWDDEKEDFLKENFEEDFKPVHMQQFQKIAETGLQPTWADKGNMSSVSDSMPFSPRLSLSARFLCRAQPKTSSSNTGVHRPDNWFSRNKMEMSRAMDETRKSLLAMNLRSNSPEELDDSPTSPNKHDRNSFSSKSNLYATSPPAGGQREDSQLEQSRYTSSGPLAKKINKEKERRRSTTSKSSEISTDSPSNSPKSVSRPRPSYFKTTQSSRNKVNKEGDKDSPSSSSSGHIVDPPKRKSYAKSQPRMPSSKLSFYASSPNLAFAYNEIEDDTGSESSLKNFKKVRAAKVKSMSNLKALADLSKSVPDVNDCGSSTDSSNGPTHQPRQKSVFGPATKITTKYASGLTDIEMMPPPATDGFLSKKRFSQEPRERNKSSSTSEMTLDEAKSILLGKSGILDTKTGCMTNITVATASTSSTDPNPMSSNSNPTSQSYPSASGQADIDPMSQATPVQLAMAEEIEHTANMLRHQNQVNMMSSHSNLEASPLDPPERDGPPARRKSHPPSSLVSSASSSTFSSPSSQAAYLTTSSLNSRVSGMGIPVDSMSGAAGTNTQEGEDEKHQSVRDRIARLNTSNSPKSTFNSKHGRTSSPHRRVLPASPQVVGFNVEAPDSSRISSDTGLGSESELEVGTSHSVDTNGAVGPSLRADRSKLALPLVSSPSSQEQVRNCKAALDDFRFQLRKLKDLLALVDGRTDESSRIILTMMGEAFHEAQSIILELASQTPSPSPGGATKTTTFGPNNDQSSTLSHTSSSLHHSTPPLSLPSSQGRLASSNTFQPSSGIPAEGSTNGNDDSPTPSSSSSTAKYLSSDASPYMKDLNGQQVAALAATKDLLQPLISHLSQDLSEGILKLVRDKLDQASSDTSRV